MTKSASFPFVWPHAMIYARPSPAIFTRQGFHSYFAKALSGLACHGQTFIDWRGLRLPCYLKRSTTAVRQAFPFA
ncbi:MULTISPECIES: hypothetical protein [unclassified Janthinobacterium]|uniref:hypothetical protein n=1 Tax=unclassified Janthinobacterium TaxID=2610881 RepID=UPI00161552DA|nr:MULTISPECIES: hypothetical protein [unclassified Janthinobacterium]MBB5610551.1 hypothetical protein [Janthinobacterium sp. S3T4]MBB5615995.1 hypothetical protein [Janthinobacterium sp. S3M3]